MPEENLKNFQNPSGYWEYAGAYSVELVPGTSTSIIPSTARVDGNIIRVSDGRVGQSIGGITLESQGRQFHWGYKHMKVIRDGNGNPIWVNRNYC